MKIGNLQLDSPTVFAPLAGISNLPLRLLAKEAGCGLVCSEMVSSHGLVYGSEKTRQLLVSTAAEKPLSAQIFGSDAQIMAQAALHIEAAGADIIDINFGCAVKKILKSGSGAALMQEPQKAAAILKAVRNAVGIPLTIKMRSGWDSSGQQALHLARIAQDSGVAALTIHPRTARQGFSGRADWTLIANIRKVLTIPVIGNGDVGSAHDALRLFKETGCHAVMVGRAAIGNPFIFSQINDLLAGHPMRPWTLDARIAVMLRYLNESVHCLGEAKACLVLRSRLNWFVKGLPRASQFRQAIRQITSESQVKALISEYASAWARTRDAE